MSKIIKKTFKKSFNKTFNKNKQKLSMKNNQNISKKNKQNVSKKKYKRKTQKGGSFTVILGTDESEYKLTKTLEGDTFTIFKIEIPNCVRHFKVQNTDLIDFDYLFMYENIYVDKELVDVKGILVPNRMSAIYQSKPATFWSRMNSIKQQLTWGKHRQDKTYLKRNKVISLLLSIIPSPCEEEINIELAQNKLQHLDELLKIRCPKMSLTLDYIYNMKENVESYSGFIHPLLLCLNNNEFSCISNIELFIKDGVLTINCQTNNGFEGKKYNKLLRAVVILIAPYLDCTKLTSNASNPISTRVLMYNFNATTRDRDLIQYLLEQGKLVDLNTEIITKDMVDWATIQEFYKIKNKNIDHEDFDFACLSLDIDLSDIINIENAQRIFNELVDVPVDGEPVDGVLETGKGIICS
jgi:hypothetical protein